MRITGYSTRVVSAPVTDLAVPATMSIFVLLELRTDVGIDGVSYASRISPQHTRAFVHTLETALEPLIEANPLAIERIVSPPPGGGGLAASVFRRAGSWPGPQPRVASTVDVALAKALAQLDPYWLEDPMPLDDYEGMSRLRDACELRICAGEQYRDLASFRRVLEHRSVDIAMVDLDLGITGFMKVAHMAEAFGVPVVSHLATEIMAPCVAAVPNGLTVEYVPYAQPFLRDRMQVVDGELVLSQLPGVGIEFDEAAVRELAA